MASATGGRPERDHVRTQRRALQSDPELCKRMMFRTFGPVQSQTGTEVFQVPVKCRWKAKHYKHLRKE